MFDINFNTNLLTFYFRNKHQLSLIMSAASLQLEVQAARNPWNLWHIAQPTTAAPLKQPETTTITENCVLHTPQAWHVLLPTVNASFSALIKWKTMLHTDNQRAQTHIFLTQKANKNTSKKTIRKVLLEFSTRRYLVLF